MRLSFALALVATLAAAAPASAKVRARFLLDGAAGVSIPLGDSDYNKFADPTFKLSIRAGAELWFPGDRIGLAPDFTFDIIPVKTDDGTYRSNGTGIDTPFARVRGLFGARLLLGFPERVGAFFFRFGIGFDYLTGDESASVKIGPIMAGGQINLSSTAFTAEPGFGFQFHVVRWGVVGFSAGFPIALHDFNRPDVVGIQKFTAVDLDLLAFFGIRI